LAVDSRPLHSDIRRYGISRSVAELSDSTQIDE
jgi:hypothetical protein